MIDIVAALESSFDEIHYLDFYREIFPEGSFEEKGVYEDGKYNGIAVAIEKGGKRTKRLTVTDDLDAIADMAASDDFCLMSPISYTYYSVRIILLLVSVQCAHCAVPAAGVCVR